MTRADIFLTADCLQHIEGFVAREISNQIDKQLNKRLDEIIFFLAKSNSIDKTKLNKLRKKIWGELE